MTVTTIRMGILATNIIKPWTTTNRGSVTTDQYCIIWGLCPKNEHETVVQVLMKYRSKNSVSIKGNVRYREEKAMDGGDFIKKKIL